MLLASNLTKTNFNNLPAAHVGRRVFPSLPLFFAVLLFRLVCVHADKIVVAVKVQLVKLGKVSAALHGLFGF